MRRLLLILAAAGCAAVAAPAALGASPGGVTTLELVTDGTRDVSGTETRRFTLAGIHWRGSGRVTFRTRSLAGDWSAWRSAAPEDEDGPDPGSAETRVRAGWRIGNPWWVGPSDRIEVRTSGRVGRVRAHLVWSPETRVPFRIPAATTTPPIVPRLSWGADESIRRAPPVFADQVRFSVVHHTAGRNDYSRGEAAAIVKGIQLYHVHGNGWNDIGYNFLVDRFGTIYEGRFGGSERNVVGAHAQGFNTGSVGIALLGTYGNTAPSRAAQDAIAALVSWRLDLAHVDPTAALTFVSGGSNRFPNGVPVLLRGVSGHRDTGFTECPGNQLYGRLNGLAAAAGSARWAEDLRAACRIGRRFRPLSGKALVEPALGGRRHGCRKGRGCAGHRHGHDSRLDLGLAPRSRGSVHVDDQERFRAPRERPASSTRRERASRNPGHRGVARGDLAER